MAMTARMEMKEETEAGKRQVTTQHLPAGGGRWGAARDLFPSQCPRPLPFLSPELDVPRAGLGE